MDRISDLAHNPIEEAEQDERQNKLITLRNQLKKETKNHEHDKQTRSICKNADE